MKRKTEVSVQILFADDNYGNIMTVQPPGKNHPAGAGIYYHVDCEPLHFASVLANRVL